MSPTSISGGGKLLTGGELISPASLKGQEEVLPTAKLEQWPYNEAGKPLVEGLFFNLSHSGDYAVLAEADGPVGVDIEKMSPYGDWVREALTAWEYEWMLRGKDERERQERFYRLWTRKESLVKCEGHGFSLSPGEISTMPVDEARLIAYAGKTYGICSHIFHGYMLSAALQGKQPLIRLRDWSWADLAVKAAQRNKIILR